MSPIKQYILIFLLVFVSLPSFAGGGWVYGKNEGYFKMGQNMIRSPYYFDGDGEIIDIPTVSLYTTSIYAEYGLSNRFTALIYMPFFVRTTVNKVEFNQSGTVQEGDDLNSFGDTNIGLKYGFLKNGPVVMAVSLTLGLPFGSTKSVLQTGDGEFNQLIKLEASHSFYPKPFYASALLGFNNRTEGFSEEFHYGGEVGWTTDKLTTILKLYSVNSLYNGNAMTANANGVFSNNTEYFSITPEVLLNLTSSFGVTGSAGFATSGRRILASPNFGVGLYWQL